MKPYSPRDSFATSQGTSSGRSGRSGLPMASSKCNVKRQQLPPRGKWGCCKMGLWDFISYWKQLLQEYIYIYLYTYIYVLPLSLSLPACLHVSIYILTCVIMKITAGKRLIFTGAESWRMPVSTLRNTGLTSCDKEPARPCCSVL